MIKWEPSSYNGAKAQISFLLVEIWKFGNEWRMMCQPDGVLSDVILQATTLDDAKREAEAKVRELGRALVEAVGDEA